MHSTAFQLLITALCVLLASRIVPGIRVRSMFSAGLFALALAVLTKLLFALLVILTLPAVILSLGVFLLVINAFLFWLADKIVPGVEVDGFGAAFLGSLVTSLLTSIAYWLIG